MKNIVTALTLLGIAFGAYFHIDNRYALAKELQLVEMRLDQKITNDEILAIQKIIYQLEDQYQDKHMPESVKDDIRDLKQYLEQLKSKKKGGS